jgi:two-component system response regulator YesN
MREETEKKKVLVIDDDPIILRCLQELIEWEKVGCQKPLSASNGSEALEIIRQEHLDIIVSDIKMPVMDGRELCRIVYEEYPDVRIFFVSAYEDFTTAQIAIRYNVKGYVLKPLDKGTLLSLQNMISEVVNQQENTIFLERISEDAYRSVLKDALVTQSMEIPNMILDKLQEVCKGAGAKDTNLWKHLLVPIIDYRNTELKMDFGILFEMEQQMETELMSYEIPERIEYLRGQYQSIMVEKKNSSDYIIWEIQKEIRKQFMSPNLDVNVIAAQFHMSPVYLGRIFAERTGNKITEYIQEVRIRFSCNELRNSVKSVKEIALLSGYQDVGYFNKIFRSKTGMTPTEYRKKHWGLEE